jgi:hypothetical protein
MVCTNPIIGQLRNDLQPLGTARLATAMGAVLQWREPGQDSGNLAQLESGHLDQMCQVFRNSTINPSLRTRESRGRQSAW